MKVSPPSTTSAGRAAELMAQQFLERKGWQCVAKNFLGPGGEIDLVFIDQKFKQLVFVEVKARKSEQFGSPAEAVTPHKLLRIQRVGEYFMQTHPKLPQSGRVDIVSIIKPVGSQPTIEHIENIF
jgi:putative endonuclease